MPLSDYGVAIGTYVTFARDPQDQYGHWYHGHLTIYTPAGNYQSALDVDTPTGVGVSFKTVEHLDASRFATISSLSNGWHQLLSTPTSGALDYIRSELLLARCPRRVITTRSSLNPWRFRFHWIKEQVLWMLCLVLRQRRGWISSTGDNALSTLEQLLPNCKRVFIFGEHYTNGLGVHDVHMNQGDPSGSAWYASNGIWQDGGVVIQRPDDSFVAWLVRFNSQSLDTDDNGHPR